MTGAAARLATEKGSTRHTSYCIQELERGVYVSIPPYLPPLIVSHEGFPVICNKWWLCMKRIRVFAGKSVAHTSGGVLHTAAVMGYNEMIENEHKGEGVGGNIQ